MGPQQLPTNNYTRRWAHAMRVQFCLKFCLRLVPISLFLCFFLIPIHNPLIWVAKKEEPKYVNYDGREPNKDSNNWYTQTYISVYCIF